VVLGSLLITLPLLAGVSPPQKTTIEVIVPDADNLQHMAFWVARGAGYFADEGLEITPLVSNTPGEAEDLVRARKAPAAVLSPPMYLRLIADRTPIALAANLLTNDPIDLIVRRELLASKKITPKSPLKERLLALRGLKIGVAPGPPVRLRALFESVGLDANRDVELVTVAGPSQNELFAQKGVDALYCHTPFLERAIVDQGAVILVDQSGGEVPELAGRQIHALVFERRFVEERAEVVKGMTRAIARAEALVHGDRGRAVAALLKEFPEMVTKHVETIVRVYEPAIPKTPRVWKGGFGQALALYPSHVKAPNLEGIDLSTYLIDSTGPR
jgi:NitT/TauT family transport system substrate-binding protein